jgi:hypothetical protein
MTDEEWLSCCIPEQMVELLNPQQSDRKLRLFAAACCRRIWHLLTDIRGRRIVEISELYADQRASYELLVETVDQAKSSSRATWATKCAAAVRCASYAASRDRYVRASLEAAEASAASEPEPSNAIAYNALRFPEYQAQARFLRDIFGNPLRLVQFDPQWRTANVVDLARTIYEERAFERLPILADALMDAGCADEQVLQHCRSEGPHVRGCWVVDLVLGKE